MVNQTNQSNKTTKVPHPARDANKLAGAFQCAWDGCGKSIDDGPLIEFVVCCGRNRKTRIWTCVEHILGIEALKVPAIADNVRSSAHHRRIDENRRIAGRNAILASRFTNKSSVDIISNKDHDFVKDETHTEQRRKSSHDSFVPANTLVARLGIPSVAIAELVKNMNIVMVNHNGIQSVKTEDFDLLSGEVRRRTIENRMAEKNSNSSFDISDNEGQSDSDENIEIDSQ